MHFRSLPHIFFPRHRRIYSELKSEVAGMKKWWAFPLIAVVAVGGIRLLSGDRQEVATVRTAVLQPQAVEQTVS